MAQGAFMIYIHLYNGRETPDAPGNCENDDGPTFGPYENIQVTYGAHIKMRGGVAKCLDELAWSGNNIYYDGVWYGDMVVFPAKLVFDGAPDNRLVTYDKYDEAKTRVPVSQLDEYKARLSEITPSEFKQAREGNFKDLETYVDSDGYICFLQTEGLKGPGIWWTLHSAGWAGWEAFVNVPNASDPIYSVTGDVTFPTEKDLAEAKNCYEDVMAENL
jgi:hypothetical protein